jgi:hypothetical protein
MPGSHAHAVSSHSHTPSGFLPCSTQRPRSVHGRTQLGWSLLQLSSPMVSHTTAVTSSLTSSPTGAAIQGLQVNQRHEKPAEAAMHRSVLRQDGDAHS